MNLYPLQFEPIYKRKIWGGDSLQRVYNRELPESSIGESWEVAAHPHGTSIIANGLYQGRTLTELISKNPEGILGSSIKYKKDRQFPLLIKFIDANDKLSVQVHPDNNYAQRIENESGKTEMWYILEAKPGAKLVYGLKPGTKKDTFSEAIKNGKVETYINEVEVTKGDIFYMPSGTIHAIEDGILLAEIQQNSNTTYRVYDWNRTGEDGKARELHVEKALDVINFDKINNNKSIPLKIENEKYNRSFLAASPYFVIEKIRNKVDYQFELSRNRFYILINLEGDGEIISNNKRYSLNPGKTYFLPAGLDKIKVIGMVEFLLTYIPDGRKEIINVLKKFNFNQKQINRLAGINDWHNKDRLV